MKGLDMGQETSTNIKTQKEWFYPSMNTLNKNSMQLVKDYQNAVLDLIQNYEKGPDANLEDTLNVWNIYYHWAKEIVSNPNKIFQAQSQFVQDYFAFLKHFQDRLFSESEAAFIVPHKTDKRFLAPEWSSHPLFYFYQQSYLLSVRHCLDYVQKSKSRNPKIAKQITFFTQQYLDAISPTNCLLTNPEILEETLRTKGENLINGFRNFLEDIEKGHGHWNITMTDMTAFEVGQNVAITPGKVIYQNRMMQLIQYSPTTQTAYQRPLLIIPPWINKYYILDLTEKNSLVKASIEQGFTVFMISWVNPDESYKDTVFEDYLSQGIVDAMDAIFQATGEKEINTLGFCIGGTLLATAMGLLKKRQDPRIKSATFLTTLIDFSNPGDMEAFIDEKQVCALENRMALEGYLDGRLLMTTFNMLRANDLFWSFYVNNYLRGRSPFPFDLLYWNCDSTNLPAKMHSFYLRNMYLENKLSQGKLWIGENQIDLSCVDTPCYFLSAELDHIAPWEATFEGAKYLGGPITFVLAGSGHISGVINPPSKNKYYYRYAEYTHKINESPSEWLTHAKEEKGSWWSHWFHWLKQYSGALGPIRIPGEGKLAILQDAPGDYVKKRLI